MDNTINVEKIMEEIREEIREKGYTPDLLSFDDISIDVQTLNTDEFNQLNFNEGMFAANHNWNVQTYHVYEGNPIKVLIKKVLRKMSYFFVTEVMIDQNKYNAAVIQSLNQIDLYMQKTNKEIEELKLKIKELEKADK